MEIQRAGDWLSWLGRLVANADRGGASEVDDLSYEDLIRQELGRTDALDLAELIERVALEAMRLEAIRGAWTTDVGLWGPSVFRREAASAVRRMIGRSLALQAEGTPLAMPVPTSELRS